MGVGDTSAALFLRIGLRLGETAADLAAEGEAAFSTGEVGSAVFCGRCFGGGDDSTGVPVSS